MPATSEEPGVTPSEGRLAEITRRFVIAGLAVIVIIVSYCWLVRIGNDLSWDESLNFKTYSRHPLAAIALYREPNNHPLDSLFKSVFYGVLGLDSAEFYKFPGFSCSCSSSFSRGACGDSSSRGERGQPGCSRRCSCSKRVAFTGTP